ncbi:chromate transporter [Clostridium sp. D2Q-14]|uniref:chromate transporter n=1 Tax=Anaeromonas gelatinilytica TaxID=2683194 RepID=UPI00193C1760|nr:chromate transporter [Anaeromonas gelatinilytica]MBS4536460.1 chromate transporter [Anaeromonas gelatinilytica]
MKELFKYFMTFFKIGFFTIGGGYAMIPILEKEVVDNNKWLTQEEFVDTIAIAQSAPGALAINACIFIGNKIKKISGAIACALGVAMPSFLIILTIAKFVYGFRDNIIVSKVFEGLTPAVVGLIGASLYSLVKSSGAKGKLFIVPVLAFIAIGIFNINPIFILLVAAIGSILLHKYSEKEEY